MDRSARAQRPYTFVVLAILILFVGPFAILRTPTDIFPNINIPVVTVVWNYGGLSADEMAYRIVNLFERGLTTTVNDIEHIESQTLRGIAVIKVFFQPGAKVEAAIAQVTAIAQSIAAADAAGHDAAAHHHVQRLERADPAARRCPGKGLSEQQLFDFGVNFIRTQLATVQGASIPLPYGGKQPQIQVDLDPAALQAKGLSTSAHQADHQHVTTVWVTGDGSHVSLSRWRVDEGPVSFRVSTTNSGPGGSQISLFRLLGKATVNTFKADLADEFSSGPGDRRQGHPRAQPRHQRDRAGRRPEGLPGLGPGRSASRHLLPDGPRELLRAHGAVRTARPRPDEARRARHRAGQLDRRGRLGMAHADRLAHLGRSLHQSEPPAGQGQRHLPQCR